MANDNSKGPITGLPPLKSRTDSIEEANLSAALERGRLCPKCGKPGRVVSNYLGVNAHCGPCQIHWPVTNSALRPEVPSSLPRGLSKQTSVEPDWSLAFDKDVGE